MSSVATKSFVRPRAYVRVSGPDAADLLQRIVSNDVLASESCEALILTPKGRVIAPLLVWRRGEDDFLLLTEPELGETVRAYLTRMRVAAKCEIELEEHVSAIVLGGSEGIPTVDYGVPAVEVIDPGSEPEPAADELERLRILARTPRWGREIDDGILPAEAGLDERAVSFTKGCYPGQEPLARLAEPRPREPHVSASSRPRARPARRTRSASTAARSAASRARCDGLALAYVRVEVPDGAERRSGGPPGADTLTLPRP